MITTSSLEMSALKRFLSFLVILLLLLLFIGISVISSSSVMAPVIVDRIYLSDVILFHSGSSFLMFLALKLIISVKGWSSFTFSFSFCESSEILEILLLLLRFCALLFDSVGGLPT